MKALSVFFILALIISESYSQESLNSGVFNSEGYSFTTKNLYKQFKQADITDIRLSVRTISVKNPENSFIFYPETSDGNKMCLFDLLIWAIREKTLQAYSPNETSEFDYKLTWTELDNFCFPKDTIRIEDAVTGELKTVLEERNKTADINSYLLLESTIFGKNNTILSVRPIGLCPVLDVIRDESSDTLKRKMFWVYYPDIMDMLTRFVPAVPVKGLSNANDFFTKNMYKGELFPYYHSNTTITDKWVFGDTTQQLVDGFDAKWIYEKTKDGMYVPFNNSFYMGNPELKLNYYWTEPSEINPVTATIECAKYVYKTIDLKEKENYPLYFPESPFRGQKSLIDIIKEGIDNGEITAYFPNFDESSFEQPMTMQEVNVSLGLSVDTMYVQDVNTGLDVLKVVSSEIVTSEIKQYIIKEVEFYDITGNCVLSKPVALYAIREYKRNFSYGEDDVIMKNIAFCIPFNDKFFNKKLHENFVYMFSPGSFESYANFFSKKRYKAVKTEIKPSSVASALKEYAYPGIGDVPVYSKTEIIPDISAKGKIVNRMIQRSDSTNIRIFEPEYNMNGLTTFINWLYSNIDNGFIQCFEDSNYNDFGKQLNTGEIKFALGVINDTIFVEDIETGQDLMKVIPGALRSSEFKKIIIKELHINGKIYIIGVLPVREIIYNNMYGDIEERSLRRYNTCWFAFNKETVNAMSQQEIYRSKCEPGKTFYDFFEGQKYKGEVISEKEISAEEIKSILEGIK